MPEREIQRNQDTSEFPRLLERVRRAYPVVVEPLSVGPLTLRFIHVADPDVVLQQMEAGDGKAPPWQPYWAEAWESARAVAEVLIDRELDGASVLDLGCGLGLTGAVAAARGARVLMADAARPALLFARLNAWPWRERVQVRELNWRVDRLADERFDLIIGSDVLYERDEWSYLEEFFRHHLADQGQVLLGEPGRRNCDDFRGWLSSRGWMVEQTAFAIDSHQGRILEAEVDAGRGRVDGFYRHSVFPGRFCFRSAIPTRRIP